MIRSSWEAVLDQGREAQEPLCLRLASPGMPYWSRRDERILGRRKEGPSQVSGANPVALGMSPCWARWVWTKRRELCGGKGLLTR